MEQEYNHNTNAGLGKIFAKIGEIEPPKALAQNIRTAITRRELHSIQIRLYAWSALAVASISALVFTIRNTIEQMSQTGTSEILSTLFTDFSQISSHWIAYALSLLQAFPVLPIAADLTLLVVLLSVARKIALTVTPKHFITSKHITI